MASWILGALAASSAWMAAVGWYVGLVHYPTFRYISAQDWAAFHAHHSLTTGTLVVGPMLAQIAATFALVAVLDRVPMWVVVGSFLCLALSVGWTGVVSGPIHGQMVTKDPVLIERLISTNWPRAVAWTAQALIALWPLVMMKPSA